MNAPARIEPRLLTKEQAAAYCGYSPSSFARHVDAGTFPGPVPATHRWDRKALDRALDRASGIPSRNSAEDALAEWGAKHGARHA